MSDATSINSVWDRRRWLTLGVIGIAQLMIVLDVTVMNIALPSAQRALHFTTVDRQWVVTAYTGARAAHPPPSTPARDHPHQAGKPTFRGNLTPPRPTDSVDLLGQRRSGHYVSLELLCWNGQVQGAEQR